MRKRNRKALVILVILCVAWFAFIYLMSSMEGDASDDFSRAVIKNVCQFISPSYRAMSEAEQWYFVRHSNNNVREAAHVLEYFVAACLVFWAVAELYSKRARVRYGAVSLITFYICILCAGADEFHQLFVGGRAGLVIDVVQDCIGIIVGIGLMGLISVYKRDRAMKVQRRIRMEEYNQTVDASRNGVVHDRRTEAYLQHKKRRR